MIHITTTEQSEWVIVV